MIGPHSSHPRKAYPPDLAVCWEKLTPRERQVAELTAQGYEEREIAALLGIASGSVAAHRANIAAKIPGGGTSQSKIARLYAAWAGASTEGRDPRWSPGRGQTP
jgi:DNA-binding CsgD family transcriptional regulator